MKKQKIKKLYVAVSQDEYELPIAVTDSVKEMASLMGVKPETIIENLSRHRNKRGFKKYHEVQV